MLFGDNMAGTVGLGTEPLRVFCLEITWQILLIWVQRHCECVVWRYMAGTVDISTEALRVCCL